MNKIDESDKVIIRQMAQLKVNLDLAQQERDHYKSQYGELNFLLLKILQGQPGREYRVDREAVGKSLDPRMYKVHIFNDMDRNELVIKLLGIDEELDANTRTDNQPD